MHQYIENVRKHIEDMSGNETYLTGLAFFRIQEKLKYENNAPQEERTQDYLEQVYQDAITIFDNFEKNSHETEIFSWHTCIFRDLVHYLHSFWEKELQEKMFAPDTFADMRTCLTIESSSERAKEDPTKVYTKLLKVLDVCNSFYVTPISSLMEMKEYYLFEGQLENDVGSNGFFEKRLEKERKKNIFLKNIGILQEAQEICSNIARFWGGKKYLIWLNLALCLEAIIIALKVLPKMSLKEGLIWDFDLLIEEIFPHKLTSEIPNTLCNRNIYVEVIRKLTQASRCLYLEKVKNENSFEIRDRIVNTHIKEQLKLQISRELHGTFIKTNGSLMNYNI